MIGITFWAVALSVGALAESPSGKTGATSYSVYHRKFEPSDGPPRSVSYSTKLGPNKHSSPRGDSFSKDSPTSFVKGSGPAKDTQSYSDGPSYSKSGSSYSNDGPPPKSSYSNDGPPAKGSYSNDGPPAKGSYSNDGPPPKGSYSNDGPNYSKGSSSYSVSPNYSGENYDGFNPSTPSYSGEVSYDAAPNSNNPPPVYDSPNVPDVPYNNPSYVPPPPANVPQYDGPPVSPPFVNGASSFPVSGASSYPINGASSYPINGASSYPINGASSFPVNVPAPQFSSYSSGHSNFPSVNIPNVGSYSNVGNFPNVPNVGNFQNFPNVGNFQNIPNVGNFPNVGNLNIPKPSFSAPFVNPGQFSYPIDRSGSQQFSSPIKVYQQSGPLQQPLLLASAKVPIIFRPSYHSQSG